MPAVLLGLACSVLLVSAGLAALAGKPQVELWRHMARAEWEVLKRDHRAVADYHDRDVAWRCETGTAKVNILFYRMPHTIGGAPSRLDEQFMAHFRHRFAQLDPQGRVELSARFADAIDCATVLPTGRGREATVVVTPVEQVTIDKAATRFAELPGFAVFGFADRPDAKFCPSRSASGRRRLVDTKAVEPHRVNWTRYRLVRMADGVRFDPAFWGSDRQTDSFAWWAAATFAGGCYWYPGGGSKFSAALLHPPVPDDIIGSAIGALPNSTPRPQRRIRYGL